MINVTPVILCGGSGTRLWPLSRTGFPKQFLCLTGKESLFQQAALRLAGLGNTDIQVASPIIVTGEDHRFLASEQLREIGVELACALLEPVGRNTAPALTLAALAAMQGDADPVLVVTPADQTVVNTAAFTAAMQRAVQEATNGSIVILGVTPDKPETGYGYIQINQAEANTNANTVRRFVEKPDASTAQTYLNEGGYYWNAGMFVLKASVWIKALEQFRPDILRATQTAWGKRSADNTFVRPGKAEFAAIPSESVDYAAMEHCPGSNFPIKMVPLDAGWNDLGAWDAVWNVLPKDEAGLRRLPAYLQQLEMESNGKRVDLQGRPLPYNTAGVVWGEVGSNSQHAFFQWLHQGTQAMPLELLLVKHPEHPLQGHHRALLASGLAQAQALMEGQSAGVDQLAGHQDFPGNRPSTIIGLNRLTPASLGALLAMYEHRTFVAGVMWGINSFDQFGVELGKTLATQLEHRMQSGDTSGLDASTANWVNWLRGAPCTA